MEQISERQCRQYAKAALMKSHRSFEKAATEEYARTSGFAYSVIGSTNIMAYMYVAEAIDLIEEKGLLKQQVKKLVNNTLKAYKDYFNSAVGRLAYNPEENITKENAINLWNNIGIQVYGKVYGKIEEFEKVMESKIRRHYKNLGKESVKMAQVINNIDYKFYAKLFTSLSLVELAVQRYNAIFAAMAAGDSCGYDFRKEFPEFNLKHMVYWWSKAVDDIVVVKRDPAFNKDEVCRHAYLEIDRVLSDMDIINDSALTAFRYDPCYEKYAEEVESIINQH